MGWFFSEDLDEFRATAGDFLRLRPAENTALLTVTETLHERGSDAFGEEPPRFGWWRAGNGAVGGAFLQTPPHPLLLSRAPEPAVAALAETLAAADNELSGINAGQRAAEVFAAEWLHHTGTGSRIGERHRLYRLGELTPPVPVPEGRARLATGADRDLLLEWFDAFNVEVGHARESVGGAVDDRISYGGVTIWEVDGSPVGMAGNTRRIAGMVRIGPVYTPPDLRRKGYGGAVTAAVSQAARDAGAREVLLFTDLTNPTSNALYQSLGYRPVEDRVVLSFAPMTAGAAGT